MAWINVENREGEKYSTDEQVVGTWIDGKPLYEKTIQDTMPTVTTAGQYVVKNIAHNVSNMGIKFITQSFLIDSVNISRSLLYLLNSGYQIKCSVGGTALQLVSGVTDFNGNDLYVTIRYTKTTD